MTYHLLLLISMLVRTCWVYVLGTRVGLILLLYHRLYKLCSAELELGEVFERHPFIKNIFREQKKNTASCLNLKIITLNNKNIRNCYYNGK